MKELKEPYSFEQQLNKLIEHGMICEDPDAVLDFLKKKNYYRITGYALQQRVSAHDSNYSDGTTFDNIYKIYLFDQAIRNILRKYIEIAEIYYRTQISYGFSMQKCTDPPHDQHYDENNFYKKDGYKGVMDNFQREKKYYEDSLIMKHHKSKYNSRLPLWAMVEMMSQNYIVQCTYLNRIIYLQLLGQVQRCLRITYIVYLFLGINVLMVLDYITQDLIQQRDLTLHS